MLDTFSTLAQLPGLLALRKGMAPRPIEEKDCIAKLMEANAVNHGDRPAVVTSDGQATWAELNALANRYAHALREGGIGRGDVVSVMMENRVEFLALLMATNKLGAIAGCINNNLTGRQLIHCINVTNSKKCVFGSEVAEAIGESRGEFNLNPETDLLCVPDGAGAQAPEWATNFTLASDNQPTDNLPETADNTLGDTAFYIFTSGTTGLPKAAVLTNRRFMQAASLAGLAGLKCTEQDRLYVCLPLYHGTGLLIGVGSSLTSGASMFVRRKFSASAFLGEIREHECTGLIYIGELCRYLMNTAGAPDDHDNPLTKMMGNGLRPDIWMEFKQRYGIKRITEFYGASEGNVAFANLLNKDCTVGMTSAKVALVKYDVDADEIVRDDKGLCIEVSQGEPGLLLGHINPEAVFEGYTDPEATEKKITRNVLEEGDSWFNTGDLLREVDVGFNLGYPHYQFVDRLGDTFRWKSENVSTNEVGEIINGFAQVEFCNVYGVMVPQTDGRAGMAAINLKEGVDALDLDGFSQYVNSELAAYARPVFLRIQGNIDVTGTFKMVKGDLKRQGYDLAQVSDPLYVMLPGEDRYQPLTPEIAESIAQGSARF